MVQANQLLEALIYDKKQTRDDHEETITAIKKDKSANSKRSVFIVVPNPYLDKGNDKELFKYASRCIHDSLRRGETPVLCFSTTMGLYGFGQFMNSGLRISEHLLFDASINIMTDCDYVAIYVDNDISDSMEDIIGIAKIRVKRIDVRTV